ncbi:MAG: RNA methyltransferase, partial [Bacteroidetes bacterium]|nr:RNA methyltransferase [Bacteroidota bacterium]
MISKNRAAFIVSLQKKKHRDENGLYVIEGDKMVKDYLMAGMPVVAVYAKREWIASNRSVIPEALSEVVPVTYDEIRRISALTTPHNAIALVRTDNSSPGFDTITAGYSLALETVQDPGNLGTIIRSAAWFGIPYIICTRDTVDCYNPKVVQASMGGLLSVKVLYEGLESFLGRAREAGISVFGTYTGGSGLSGFHPPENGIILLGNESRGISGALDGY